MPRLPVGQVLSSVEQQQSDVFIFFTPKGGVGKTTLTYNMGAGLADLGAVVGFLDVDGQSNLAQNYLQARINQLFPGIGTLHVWKIIDCFLRGDFYHHSVADGKTLDIRLDAITHAQYEQLIADKEETFANVFLLYRLQPQALPHATRHLVQAEWRLCGFNKQGEWIDMRFVHRDKAIVNKLRQQALNSAIKSEQSKGRVDFEFNEIEKKNLLQLIGAQLEYFDPTLYPIYKALVRASLVTEEQEQAACAKETVVDYFCLSKEGANWHLTLNIHDAAMDVDIKSEIPGLLEYLKNNCHDVEPQALTNNQKDWIKHLLRQYRLVNLLDACLPWINTDTVHKNDIQRLAMRLCPIFMKNPDKKQGYLMLIPGGYLLLLEVNRALSNAIQNLSTQGVNNIAKLYALNELVRSVLAYYHIQAGLFDPNPDPGDLVSTLVMALSNYLVTPLNPEAYNDGAMRILVDILRKWNENFSALYDPRSAAQTGHCRPITSPPKMIGYCLQKMPIKSNDLPIEQRAIAEEIARIFGGVLKPLLEETQMYPEGGIPGFDESGNPMDRKPVGIPTFTRIEIAQQKTGKPVVWLKGKESPIPDAFRRILLRSFRNIILNNPMYPDSLRAAIQKASQKETKAHLDITDYAENIRTFYEQMSLSERVAALRTPYYRLNMVDMAILLARVRAKLFQVAQEESDSEFESTPVSLFESDRGKLNDYHTLILNPYSTEQDFTAFFRVFLSQLRGSADEQKELTYFIIPIFVYELCHWICLRVEILKGDTPHKRSISFLIDDPRGSVLVSGKKITWKPDYIFLPQKIIDPLYAQLTGFFRHLFGNSRWSFTNLGQYFFKKLDQQGGLGNDTDSGVIVLNNISDYIRLKSGYLSSNQNFDTNAIEEMARKGARSEVQKIGATDHFVQVKAARRGTAVSTEVVQSGYTIQAYLSTTSFEMPDKTIMKKRAEYARTISQNQPAVDMLIESMGLEDNSDVFVAYIRAYLERIPILYRTQSLELLEKHAADNYFPSKLISLVRYHFFKGRSRNFRVEEPFSTTAIKAVLNFFRTPDDDCQPMEINTAGSPPHASSPGNHLLDSPLQAHLPDSPHQAGLAELFVDIQYPTKYQATIADSTVYFSEGIDQVKTHQFIMTLLTEELLKEILEELDQKESQAAYGLLGDPEFSIFLVQQNRQALKVKYDEINNKHDAAYKECEEQIKKLKKISGWDKIFSAQYMNSRNIRGLIVEGENAQLDSKSPIGKQFDAFSFAHQTLVETVAELKVFLHAQCMLVFNYLTKQHKTELPHVRILIEAFKKIPQYWVRIWRQKKPGDDQLILDYCYSAAMQDTDTLIDFIYFDTAGYSLVRCYTQKDLLAMPTERNAKIRKRPQLVPPNSNGKKTRASTFSLFTPERTLLHSEMASIIDVSGRNNNCGLYALALAARLVIANEDAVHMAFLPDIVKTLNAEDVSSNSAPARLDAVGTALRHELCAALSSDQTFKDKQLKDFIQFCQLPQIDEEPFAFSIDSDERRRLRNDIRSMDSFAKSNAAFVAKVREKIKKINIPLNNFFAVFSPSAQDVKAFFDAIQESFSSENFDLIDVLEQSMPNQKLNTLYQTCVLFQHAWAKILPEHAAESIRQKAKEEVQKWFLDKAVAYMQHIDQGDARRYQQDLVALGECYSCIIGLSREQGIIGLHVHCAVYTEWEQIHQAYLDYVKTAAVQISGEELGCLSKKWHVNLTIRYPNRVAHCVDGFDRTATLVNLSEAHWQVDHSEGVADALRRNAAPVAMLTC